MLLKELLNLFESSINLEEFAEQLGQWAEEFEADDAHFVPKGCVVKNNQIKFDVDDNLVGTDFYMTLTPVGDQLSVHIEQSNGNEETIKIQPNKDGFETIVSTIRTMADPEGDFY